MPIQRRQFLGGDFMNNYFSLYDSISIIESVFRIFTYIAVITVLYKVLQALNVYINKNMK